MALRVGDRVKMFAGWDADAKPIIRTGIVEEVAPVFSAPSVQFDDRPAGTREVVSPGAVVVDRSADDGGGGGR